jgi:hypothetical protein
MACHIVRIGCPVWTFTYSDKDPMAFYCACGFLQINLQDTTGIELLPKTVADTFYNKNAKGFASILSES